MLRDLKRALLAASMMLALSGLAWAHDEQERGIDRRGYVQGYRDGYDHGRVDRERRAGYDYHSDDYRNGGRGYDNRWGDRDQFAAAYRRGYQSGYDDGFYGRNRRGDDYYDNGRDDRRGGYGRYGNNDPAYNQGYRDGIVGAREDIREHKRYDYNDHGWWQDAKRGYNRRYGDRQSYKLRYREGYEAGYRDTWENARGRGRYSDGYPGRGGGDYGNAADPAYSAGYNDGIVGAREDMHGRNSSDPTRHGWYKQANRGYDGRYDNPQDYKQRYRQGYVAGYNDTYRKWW